MASLVRRLWACACTAAGIASWPLVTTAADPAAGRQEAELCVTTTAAAAAQCGPAEVRLGRGGEVRVQVSDIVYRLLVRSATVDVVTMHGPVQIDAFSAPGAWAGDTLRFVDAEKQVRYELRLPVGRRS